MNTPMRKTVTTKTPPTPKGDGKPRDPSRTCDLPNVDDLEGYTSTSQIDPWRGQFVQLVWDYCV